MVQKNPIWVKIGDFGISKRTIEGKTGPKTLVVGTEGYMAPEILGLLDDTKEDSSYTSAVDIWSLGCFLYYVLTKTTPFPTYGSLQDFCWDLSAFPEEPLVEERVGWYGRLFIKDLMALQPHERPQASRDLVSTWAIIEDSGCSTSTEHSKDTNRQDIKQGKRPGSATAQISDVGDTSGKDVKLGKLREDVKPPTDYPTPTTYGATNPRCPPGRVHENPPTDEETLLNGLKPPCNCSNLDDEMVHPIPTLHPSPTHH